MANRNKNVMQKKDGGKKFSKSFKRNKVMEPRDNTLAENVSPNDLSWYVVDEQILNDAARIPYSIPVGMPFSRMGKWIPSQVDLPSYDDALPGIMASYIMPLLGNASAAGDAVNVAANSVYQFVRSKISGSRPYDAVDMMIYLGAMDSLFCYITWLTRLYATVYTYHQSNRYMSRALVEAQGVDYDDLVSNIAQFRASVNLLIAKVKSLYLPSVLPLFNRHSWLFSSYYIEGPSEKDQIYFHVPAGVHLFRYDNDHAGMLEAYRLHDQNPITVAGLINLLNAMVNPIYADEDFNRISGDFLKAYEGKVFTLTELPDVVTTQLINNEEVLLQFKNAKYKYVFSGTGQDAFNDHWLGNFFNYVQDPTKTFLQMVQPKAALDGYLHINGAHNSVYNETDPTGKAVRAMYYDWSKDTLLTSPHPDVTPGESMVNTRLTLAFDLSYSAGAIGEANINQIFCGSEWPIEYRLYTYHRSRTAPYATTLFWRRYDSHLQIENSGANKTKIESWIHSQEPIRSAFKYLPELTIISSDLDASTTLDPGRAYFEVDNYALVSSNTIGGLHNAAILGEYNIPKLAITQ